MVEVTSALLRQGGRGEGKVLPFRSRLLVTSLATILPLNFFLPNPTKFVPRQSVPFLHSGNIFDDVETSGNRLRRTVLFCFKHVRKIFMQKYCRFSVRGDSVSLAKPSVWSENVRKRTLNVE